MTREVGTKKDKTWATRRTWAKGPKTGNELPTIEGSKKDRTWDKKNHQHRTLGSPWGAFPRVSTLCGRWGWKEHAGGNLYLCDGVLSPGVKHRKERAGARANPYLAGGVFNRARDTESPYQGVRSGVVSRFLVKRGGDCEAA